MLYDFSIDTKNVKRQLYQVEVFGKKKESFRYFAEGRLAINIVNGFVNFLAQVW